MSIIYDALKKVETKLGDPNAKISDLKVEKRFPSSKLKICLLYIFVLGIGFLIAGIVFSFLNPKKKPLALLSRQANSYLTKLKTKTLPINTDKKVNNLPPKIPQPSQSQALPSVSVSSSESETHNPPPVLVLNGVFFSENEGYALINNQILREGDVVDGATVERINLDGVELKSEGSVIKLSTVK
jgi:hypothetical protein